MLGIFQKKHHLVDLLEGAIDIHCHLLPGIDDGAADPGVSKEMIAAYKGLGFIGAIATPHIMEDYYRNTPETISGAVETLRGASPDTEHFPARAAAEYMMDSGFVSLLADDIPLLTLKDRHVLVELSYFQKPHHLEDTLFQTQHRGYTPVLAHPERYGYIKSLADYTYLKDRGCLFQLNLLSISGHYGPDAEKKARMLLSENLYDYIATDAHKPGHLHKIKTITFAGKYEGILKKAISGTKEDFEIP